MNDFLQLEITDYFFTKNKHTKENIEPLMNIYFKSTESKLNIHEINIISNDIVHFEKNIYILINIKYDLNNVTQFNKVKKIKVPMKIVTDSKKLYYSTYLKIESELMKLLKKNQLILEMNKYFFQLLSNMIKESTNISKNEKDFSQGIIVNNNKKFSTLLFNENKIDSIIFNDTTLYRTIFNKEIYYTLDLKNKVFIKDFDDKLEIIHLKDNKLINFLNEKVEKKDILEEKKDIKDKMQIFLNELLYFYDESFNKESYLLIINNILKQI